jgi:hypothetical protein
MNANLASYSFEKYSKDSKLVTYCTTFSLIILFIFVISPLSYYKPLCIISQLIVLAILAYALYRNLNISYKFGKSANINYYDGNWTHLKTNMICSYVFSLFIFFLVITVIRTIL